VAARLIVRVVMSIVVVLRRGGGEAGGFISQRQQGVALGAGKPAAALLAGKQPDKSAGEEQTEEDGYWYDGHAWNVWTEYRPKRVR